MPRLYTVTGGSIELEPGKGYVLGRSRECEVVVDDMSCSRCHARILVGRDPASVSVEDLGSRNGTFVNEQRIDQPTLLEHGNRIKIGSSIYLFGLAEDAEVAERDLLDTGTVAMDVLSLSDQFDEKLMRIVERAGRRGSDLAGQLGTFSIVEVLQLLSQTGRSGTLHVALQQGHARIEVRNGEVQSASFEELEGFPALLMLARHNSGVFWLHEHFAPCPRTLHLPPARLLFELCCALDESSGENAGSEGAREPGAPVERPEPAVRADPDAE